MRFEVITGPVHGPGLRRGEAKRLHGDPEIIAGLVFVAEGPVGGFSFEVDEVEAS